MVSLRLTLLGGFEACAVPSFRPIHLGKKPRALVAYLGVRLGEVQSRDKLASLLWSEVAAVQARHSLRQALFELRHSCAEAGASAVSVHGETVVMHPQAAEVDVAIFERLVASGTSTAIEKAAALYRGDLLDGFRADETPFEEWLSAERDRLRALALTAFQKLLGHALQVDDRELAILTALRILRVDNTEEMVHRTLMWLYSQAGRRGAALRQYRTCVSALDRELGVLPTIETRRLYEQIADAPATGRPSAPPPSEKRTRAAILVVEGEPASRSAIQGHLTAGGYDAVVVRDGAEALSRLDRARFDLIVIPAGDARSRAEGLKLAATLGRHGTDTPMIILTGRRRNGGQPGRLGVPAGRYVGRPLQRQALLRSVKVALGKIGSDGQRRGGFHRPPRRPPEPTRTGSPPAIERGRSRAR